MCELRVLELFSGIGGMHYALKASKIPGVVIAAVEINPLTNTVYKHNYPNATVLNNNIQKLSPAQINKMNVNTMLMSPPCQPFTRNGNFQDLQDHRSEPLQHICNLLKDLKNIQYILLENVKKFEESDARNMFIKNLQDSDFHYIEFLLTPTSLGIPNSRSRYYCLARKGAAFNYISEDQKSSPKIFESFPDSIPKQSVRAISEYIDPKNDSNASLLLPDKILEKRVNVLDICHSDSQNSMCFTKGYARYAEGTGSVYSPLTREKAKALFEKANESSADERLAILKSIKLRYFSPTEVARLMCFPDSFTIPESITRQQSYRMLGNSINVEIVGNLIKKLVDGS